MVLGSLAKALGVTPDLIKRLERAGVIVPLGRDRAGRIWVDADARRQVERVQSLMAAGYPERDIALVIGRIERAPGRTRIYDVFVLADVASTEAIPPELVTRWVDDGLVAAWGVAETGELLFESGAVAIVSALAALEVLGLSDHAHALVGFIARDPNRPSDAIARLHQVIGQRIGAVERAVRVLRKLLPQLSQSAAPKPRRRPLLRRRGKGEGDASR